jgi:hypothetical protein
MTHTSVGGSFNQWWVETLSPASMTLYVFARRTQDETTTLETLGNPLPKRRLLTKENQGRKEEEEDAR